MDAERQSTKWSLWWDEEKETKKRDVNGEFTKGLFRLTLDLNESCWIEILPFTPDTTEHSSDYELWQPYMYYPTHEAWFITKKKNEWDTDRAYFISYGNSSDMAMTLAIQWAIALGWIMPIETETAQDLGYTVMVNAKFPVTD